MNKKVLAVAAAVAIIGIGTAYGPILNKVDSENNYKILSEKEVKYIENYQPIEFYDLDKVYEELSTKGTAVNYMSINNDAKIVLDRIMLRPENELMLSANISSEIALLDENTKLKDEDGNLHDLGIYDRWEPGENSEIYVDGQKLTNDLLKGTQFDKNDDGSIKCYMTFTNINKDLLSGDINVAHNFKVIIKDLESFNSYISGEWEFEFNLKNSDLFEEEIKEIPVSHEFKFGDNGTCTLEKYSRRTGVDYIYAKVENYSNGAHYYKLFNKVNPNKTTKEKDADHLFLIGYDEFGNKLMFIADNVDDETGEIRFQRNTDRKGEEAKLLSVTPYYGVTESSERSGDESERSICGEQFNIDISGLK